MQYSVSYTCLFNSNTIDFFSKHMYNNSTIVFLKNEKKIKEFLELNLRFFLFFF